MKKLTFLYTAEDLARARARGRRSARRLPQDGGRRASPPDFESKQSLSIFGALHVRVMCAVIFGFDVLRMIYAFSLVDLKRLHFHQYKGVKLKKCKT